MIHYSIIIPYYNCPKLLVRCLNSIPTREDLQVIVIDDCSPTNYLYEDIVVKYSQCNVEFYQTPRNLGAGCARNIGLKHAKGKWLIFADADDYFNVCFSDILDLYVDSLADIIFFKASSQDSDTYVNTNRCNYVNDWIDGYLLSPNVFDYHLRYLYGEPWGKIINSHLVSSNGIHFSETIIHNDTRFSYQVGYYAKKIVADRHAIYCVTEQPNSVSKQVSIERIFVRTEVFCEKYVWLKKHGVDYQLEGLAASGLNIFRKKNDIANFLKCKNIFQKYGINLQEIDCYFSQYYKKPTILYRIKKLIKKRVLKLVNAW